jgi:hypothetical protein
MNDVSNFSRFDFLLSFLRSLAPLPPHRVATTLEDVLLFSPLKPLFNLAIAARCCGCPESSRMCVIREREEEEEEENMRL